MIDTTLAYSNDLANWVPSPETLDKMCMTIEEWYTATVEPKLEADYEEDLAENNYGYDFC